MDNVKTKIYYLVINYGLAMLQEEIKRDKQLGYINKKQIKFTYRTQQEKEKMIARIRSIKDICDTLTRTSHEMLVYIALDFLMHVERDTTARNRFLHINTGVKLAEYEEKYPKELKEHYTFFYKLVDNL